MRVLLADFVKASRQLSLVRTEEKPTGVSICVSTFELIHDLWQIIQENIMHTFERIRD